MFNKNLKYYRLKKAMTKKDLASTVNISPMAITNYENGARTPNMEILKLLADALDVRISDFLAIRNEHLTFSHGEFRKNSTLTLGQQEYIKESVEEYYERFFTVVEILGGEVLPNTPPCHTLPFNNDYEQCAVSLRSHLKLAMDGPIGNLAEIIENKGILFYMLEINNDKFSGINGFVDGRPYIVINETMTTERIRSTIAHELAHLMFAWPDGICESDIEKAATAISGAFLFSKTDAIRELGLKRTSISKDMILTAQEYGISMFLLVKRARLAGIISDSAEKDFYVRASSIGWRKNEPTRIEKEKPSLFKQLVYRAVSENEINIQRGAELLKVSYNEVLEHCCFPEDF